MASRLLVTGAGGQLGRRVVEILLEKQVGPVIAVTRDPTRIADLAARGAEVRSGDFDKPETLVQAFAGADRLLLISTGDIFVPGRRLAQHRAAVAAAQAAGVKHILYTSVIAPMPSESIIENDHFWTEQAIMNSGLTWTFLRHGLYTEGLLGSLPMALSSGTWATATENQGRNWVTREDCAQADAAALASGSDECRVYDITGPAPVRADQVAALASQLTGKPLQHVNITRQQLAEGLQGAGLPPTLIGAIVGFDLATARGYHLIVSPAVAELTGRAPQSVQDFLPQHRDALLPK